MKRMNIYLYLSIYYDLGQKIPTVLTLALKIPFLSHELASYMYMPSSHQTLRKAYTMLKLFPGFEKVQKAPFQLQENKDGFVIGV